MVVGVDLAGVLAEEAGEFGFEEVAVEFEVGVLAAGMSLAGLGHLVEEVLLHSLRLELLPKHRPPLAQ